MRNLSKRLKTIAISLSILLLSSTVWGGVDLNGDADYITVGTMGNFGTGLDTNYFIFSCWFKTSLTTREALCGTFNDGNTTGIIIELNRKFDDLTDSAHDIRVFRRDEDSQERGGGVALAAGVVDGLWHNLVVAVNENTITIWLDKVSQTIVYGQANIADNMANFQYAMMVGAANNRATPILFFNGEITEVVMWSSATTITQTEVDNLAKSKVKRMPLQIKTSDLTGGYWALDDYAAGQGTLSGLTFNDLSGSGNTGTGVDADNDSDTISEEVLTYP